MSHAEEAFQLLPPRTDKPRRGMLPFGLCIHTTGDDDAVNAKAKALGMDAGAWYARFYIGLAEFFPNYVGGWDGKLYLVADEEYRTPHVGCTAMQRNCFLSRAWKTNWILYDGTEKPAEDDVVFQWVKKWGSRWPSPQHLFPGPSPNEAYIGLELAPVANGAVPMRPELKFTKAQHDLVARLWRDLATRWRWPEGSLNRLVGHEDLNPMDRPGWDPGALREHPVFDWNYVREKLDLTPRATS